MSVSIRPLTTRDAADVERLYDQSAAYHRSLGDDTDFQFSAEIYLRDGFGENPAFRGIGAVVDGELVGYLLYAFEYDTDRANRYLFILDLLVDEAVRQHGIGRALMDRASSLCRDAGGRELVWAVHEKNLPALNFYRRLGAEEIRELRFMRLEVER
jgi:ribosomal protein S18 acetylase RimI-like enzyme